MGNFFTIILDGLAGAIGGGILTLFCLSAKGLWTKNKDEDTQEKMRVKVLEALAHDALFKECRRILEQGYITDIELENLDYLYAGYHNLGLNGTGEELCNRCRQLPLKILTKEK